MLNRGRVALPLVILAATAILFMTGCSKPGDNPAPKPSPTTTTPSVPPGIYSQVEYYNPDGTKRAPTQDEGDNQGFTFQLPAYGSGWEYTMTEQAGSYNGHYSVSADSELSLTVSLNSTSKLLEGTIAVRDTTISSTTTKVLVYKTPTTTYKMLLIFAAH